MSNMSYCRFENTSRDLADCVNAMEDVESLEEMDLSSYESMAMDRMVELCRDFVAQYNRIAPEAE